MKDEILGDESKIRDLFGHDISLMNLQRSESLREKVEFWRRTKAFVLYFGGSEQFQNHNKVTFFARNPTKRLIWAPIALPVSVFIACLFN